MIKRTIEISREPAYLSVRLNQLQIRRDGNLVSSIPCEDVGVVIVDHPQTTYSHGALASLAESDAALVICGRDHLPCAVLLPLADHSQVVWRIHEQLEAKLTVRKRIWRQLIKAKIRCQAALLADPSPARSKLLALADNVKSGDVTNVEAHAARVYWGHWMPDQEFRRDQDGQGINALLNYGYAILRAALARAIVGAGMHPAIGLNHRHRANAFCLADDLIEPLRPIVDDRVREMVCVGYESITSEAKGELLKLLAENVCFAKETGPLMVNLHRYVASLSKCMRGESKKLEIPYPCT